MVQQVRRVYKELRVMQDQTAQMVQQECKELRVYKVRQVYKESRVLRDRMGHMVRWD
jgi:hypothetical protein